MSPPERGTNFTLRQNRATQSQKLCCRVHLVSLVLEKEKIVIVNSSMPSGIICFARSPLPILSSHCAELYLVLPKIIHRMNKVACRCCNERCLECQTSCVHAMRKESRLCRVRACARMLLFLQSPAGNTSFAVHSGKKLRQTRVRTLPGVRDLCQ